jgi:pilus assembly protein CpaE
MPVQITIIGSPDRKLEELLRSSGLRPTVASAIDLRGLTHPDAPQPDILIMDVRGHGQVPPGLAGLKRQHPATSLMLVASDLTPPLMLDAMRAGVTECVSEPLTPGGLGEALSRVLAHRTAPASGQVLAFIGAKGGMGTTTLAVNVASALARNQTSTLYVDMHQSYGDATVLFGAEPRFSWLDALENTHRLDLAFFSGLTAQTKSGVTLLASPEDAPLAPIDAHRIRLLLDFAIRNYRYTVLDVPRSNPAMLDALEGATQIFVVINQELASVRAASRIVNALGRRYTRDKVAVVVSRFDKDSEIGIGDIEEVVQTPVRFTFPSDYRLAVQAHNEGRPFVLGGTSALSSSVVAFARQLTGESPFERSKLLPSKALRARFPVLRWMTS